LGWNEGEADGSGGVLEAGELLPFLPGLRLGEDFRVEPLPELQPVPEDARQFVRQRR
jgi:hypothetical protein